MMANRKLKRIMTDLAAGHITKKEADRLIKPNKVENSRAKTPKTNIQKKVLKKKEMLI